MSWSLFKSFSLCVASLLLLPAAMANDLALRGQGVASYMMFDVYQAELFIPVGIPRSDILRPGTPRRLELSYKLALDKRDIEKAAWQVLQAQWPEERLNTVRPLLDQLHASMRNVQEGDIYRLEYQPGKELSLSLNGQVLWQGGDARLAEMYFGIWLREPAISPELRLSLLGKD